MSAQKFESLLTEVAEKIRQEALAEGWAQGWRDAAAAFAKAVSEMGEPVNSSVITVQKVTAIATGPPEKRLPTQGSTPWLVLETVKKTPGMTTLELVQSVAQNHSIPENSIRTSIFRMKEREFIVARHNKWYAT